MADEKHESKRNCHPRQKWLPVAAILLLVLLIAGFSVQYISFVSQTIYQESTSHLEEVLHKSNNMLKEMVRKNLTYLHLYNGFLESTSDEAEIQAYIEAAQQSTGFAEFYFLTYDGNYMTVTGETGYLGLQTNLDERLAHDEDIVVNTALPGKPQMLAFICPETQGSYRGFAYDAIAISYYNDAVLRLLDSSAFEGNASNYVIYSDGRVVIDNSVNRTETIYNFIAMLRDHSDLSEAQILDLSNAFAQGSSGNMKVKLGDTSYYLVYEGTAVQSWTMVGLVPVSIVNANLDKLWFHTIQIVAGIAAGLAVLVILLIVRRSHAALRQKNTKLLYRDELFQKLSLNVDDVFLMLDAKTYQADYVSPNVEKLLGITVEQIHKDICILRKLHSEKQEDPEKNYKRGMDCIISGHGRVMEYVNVEMIIAGYSARVEREWYTHIGGSPTRLQSSTRYINYAGRGFDYIIPPSIQNNKEALEKYQALMAHINEECRALQEDYGIPKEDVANGLPLGMTASIVDKRNLRSLTEMSHQRMCNRAYWEYRQLFGDIRKALSEYSEEWRWIADNLFMPKCDYFGYCSETRPCGKPVSGVPKMPRP